MAEIELKEKYYLSLDLAIVELEGVDRVAVLGVAEDPLGDRSHLVRKTLCDANRWASVFYLIFLFHIKGELKPVQCTL